MKKSRTEKRTRAIEKKEMIRIVFWANFLELKIDGIKQFEIGLLLVIHAR